MAFLKVTNAAIRGIAACVPEKVEENKGLPFYGPGEAEQVMEATGIERRHIVTEEQSVSDLCVKSAGRLIDELGWEKESIGLLALATQCPDYINHPTSFVVHQQLGLSEDAICMDFFHGCPGWVVAMGGVIPLVSTGNVRRAILLTGDVVSKTQYANNREEKPLFGDAGTATAIEYAPEAHPAFFNIGTKSEDGMAITRVHGGFRHPYTMETLRIELDKRQGINEEGTDEQMDSMDVFSFAITKVPKAIKKLLSEYDISIDDVDKLVLHQANKMIIETIAKRLKAPAEKVVIGLKDFGNTTSSSIPLAIASQCQSAYSSSRQRTLVCGFGTGLAWGACYFETENIKIPNIVIC